MSNSITDQRPKDESSKTKRNDEISIMNACFLYALYKCKEIPEARALANKLVNESEKSKLPISESEMEYRRFPLRYLQACICFEDRNNLNEGL